MNREELKHTEEPWYNDDMVIRQTGTNAQICEVSYDENTENPHEDIVNAKRIVECVNAFKGIEKPSEYINSLQKEIDRLKAKEKQLEKSAYNASVDNAKLLGKIELLQSENDKLNKILNSIDIASESGILLGYTINDFQMKEEKFLECVEPVEMKVGDRFWTEEIEGKIRIHKLTNN